jgi:hypothetical protein
MLHQLLRSFVWGYGKRLGSTAARKTSFLAIPALLLVGYLILAQLGVVDLDVSRIMEAFR